MRNIKLELRFDGTAYHGFQRQKNAVTIQQVLEDTLFKVFKEKIAVIGCSRTDSGVHALSFFCNFQTDASIPTERIPFALNANLPRDIRVVSVSEADDSFHARYSCLKKTYCYQILNTPVSDPFLERYALHVPMPLDVQQMNRACRFIVGSHDFKSFCASGSEVIDTVRTVERTEVREKDHRVTFEICADGFLYNMVRILTGTLLLVGEGKRQPSDLQDIIEKKDRNFAGITVKPNGLFLKEVVY